MRRVLALAMALLSCAAFGGSVKIGADTWTYSLDGGKATITGMNTRATEVEIPAAIVEGSITYPVTRIGDSAFESMRSLTHVGIPDSVTEIGYHAFIWCYGLKSITIPKAVTSIGYSAFTGCFALERVDISDLDAWCRIEFEDSSSTPLCLARRLYLDGVEVKHVSLPDDLVILGSYAFYGCESITSVTVPASVWAIGQGAFEGCGNLRRVVMEGSIVNIGSSAFRDCVSLAELELPPSLGNVGVAAFSGCDSLADEDGFVVIGGTLFDYAGSAHDLVIPDNVSAIGWFAFTDCGFIESVSIPESVTEIGASAFARCGGLREVSIPGGVETIGPYAFDACSNLVGVAIGDGVKAIDSAAFSYCLSLESIAIPDSVSEIGTSVFSGCSSLKNVTLPATLAEVPDSMFSDTALETIALPATVTNIGWGAFADCENLESFALPQNAKTISGSAFYGSGLKQVEIPASVESIGEEAFGWCHSLAEVKFLGDAPSVGTDAFYDVEYGCKALVSKYASGFPAKGKKWNGMTVAYWDDDVIGEWLPQKAFTLTGALFDEAQNVVGAVQLKVAKPNLRKNTTKVAGTITSVSGKKTTLKAATVQIPAAAPLQVSLDAKSWGVLELDIHGQDAFDGSMGDYTLAKAQIGGVWTRNDAAVRVQIDDRDALPAGRIEDLLPDGENGEPVIPKAGKWAFAKAATVKVAKGELVVDESGGKTNRSAMKLSYNAKTGIFKGSFKVYAIETNARGAKKLKKYSFTVTGIVVNGKGQGTAVCKKPAIEWSVTVE